VTLRYVVIGAVAAAVALAFAPARASAPQPGAGGASVHFTAAGDFGTSADAQGVMAGMASGSADFALALGDLSYAGKGSEPSWCNLVKSKVGPDFPFELISGNHESAGLDGSITKFAACLPNRLPGSSARTARSGTSTSQRLRRSCALS
jgi:hypothetical protein